MLVRRKALLIAVTCAATYFGLELRDERVLAAQGVARQDCAIALAAEEETIWIGEPKVPVRPECLTAMLDSKGHPHVLWIERTDTDSRLLHAHRNSEVTQNGEWRIDVVANTIGSYLAVQDRRSICITWDSRDGERWRASEWSVETATWRSLVDVASPPGLSPVYFPRLGILFWATYENTRSAADAAPPVPANAASASFRIFAAIHSQYIAMYSARIAGEAGGFNKLESPRKFLDCQNQRQSAVPLLLAADDGSCLIFWADRDVADEPIVRFGVYDPMSSNAIKGTAAWPLFSNSSQWTVAPVHGSELAWILWTGPRDQDAQWQHSLFVSNTEASWVPRVIAESRSAKAGTPAVWLSSSVRGTVDGAIAWRSGAGKVSLVVVRHGETCPEISIPGLRARNIGIVVDRSGDGMVFCLDGQHLSAIKFHSGGG